LAASQFLIVGFREEFGVIDGGGPGGETGGDGEVIVRGAVRGLGVVAGEFQKFLLEHGPAGQVCVAFQGVGGQEQMNARLRKDLQAPFRRFSVEFFLLKRVEDFEAGGDSAERRVLPVEVRRGAEHEEE